MNSEVRLALHEVDVWIKDRRKAARKKGGRFAWWGKARRVLDVMVLINILYRMIP